MSDATAPVGLFTLGEALAVFIPTDAPVLGSARSYRRTVAGSESNVAVGVSRLGLPARFITVVGEDGLGDAVEETLIEWGLDAQVGRSRRPTGVLVRELGTGAPMGAVHLRTDSAATELSPDLVDQAWSDDAAAAFVTGITAVRSPSALEAVKRTVELARDSGALVVVDPNFRPRLANGEAFEAALSTLRGHVDVAIGDAGELALLSGTSPTDAVSTLLASGCRLVITKLGAFGAVATDGVSNFAVASGATSVIDTVGAGDAFAAGIIVGLIEGADVPTTLNLATAVAARVVSTIGDVEGLPLRRELRNGVAR